MVYQLGVDLGTTYTAAAVSRDGLVQIVELGNRTATIPSVVFLKEDETILTGEAATRRAVSEPGRVAREFKRRIGDPTPLLLGGTPYSAESLSAKLLQWVIARVSEVEGAPPDRVALTHPANWGPYKLDLLHQAIRLADLEDVVTLTEPEAAAIHYATLERIEPGMVVAVFDLGGGTFDATILRKNESGYDFLGRPEGIERLGGIDFDEAVFAFVSQAVGGAVQELDFTDPAGLAAVARLRAECVDAKEALSSDTEVTVPVVLPTVQTEVRLTRSEFEQFVRPSLADTVGAMQRAVRGADLKLDDIDLVLLVGGSSRIPLVGQMVAGELGRPVAVDAHPKHSIALGAARAAAGEPGSAHLEVIVEDGQGGAALPGEPILAAEPPQPPPVAEPAPPPVPEPTPAAVPPQPASAAGGSGVGGIQPPPAPPDPDPEPTPRPQPLQVGGGDGDGSGGRTKLLIGAGIVALLVIVGAVVALGGGSDDNDGTQTAGDTDDTTPTETTAVPASATTQATTTQATTTTTEEATTTTTEAPFACPEGFCAHVDEVTVEEGELVIEWTAHGYIPDTSNLHAHFYWDIYDVTQVGTNWQQMGAAAVGSWQLTHDQPFLTAGSAVAIANAPAGATAICVVPTDSSHGVISPLNAECFDLPPELVP
ncbi:MAG: Hsp70 family protein [Actinomycetia bacterium]|nr:Hsp70 family protein [Actinomycetes bacterium]